jgi:XTP/dITP diphosphohydrolase
LSAARFFCFLSFFARGKERFSAEGTCAGFITADPRGENGFGYDPVFWVPAFGRTVAELSAADKNQISHRGAAARQMREFLLRHPEVLR